MPTYEYVCRQCGQQLEVVQSFTDDPLEVCALCGGSLRKVFSAAGIIFKGSGYYVTDSRAERSGARAKSERSSGDGGDAPGDGAADKTSSGDTSSGDTSSGDTSGGDTSGSGSTDSKSA